MKRLLYILGFGVIATVMIIGAHQICWGDYKVIVLNIFQGIYASTLVVLIVEFLTEFRLYRRLNFLLGQWTEHKINDRTLGEELVEQERPCFHFCCGVMRPSFRCFRSKLYHCMYFSMCCLAS